MKKTLHTASLATLFALTLSACGGGGGSDPNAVTPPTPAPTPAPSPGSPPPPSPSPTPSPAPSTFETQQLARFSGTWRRCQIERDTVEGGGTGTRTIGSTASTIVFSSPRPDGTVGYVETDEFFTTPDCTRNSVATVEVYNGSMSYAGSKFSSTGGIVDKLRLNQSTATQRRVSGPNARFVGNSVVVSLDEYTYTYNAFPTSSTIRNIAAINGNLLNLDFGGAVDSEGYPLQLNVFLAWQKSS